MRRRVPLQKLRGSDPTLLEVQTQDLLGRPSGQLEPANLCDLFALAEHEDPPRAIRTKLAGFVKRCSAEISEIPDGSELTRLVKDFGEVEAQRVPTSFRNLIASLVGRDGRDSAPFEQLLEQWADVEPVPFELGLGQVRVQRASVGNAPRSSTSSGGRREKGSGTSAKAADSKSKNLGSARPKTVIDIDRRNWIVETVIERLWESSETGLGEAVLIAGIRHRARTVYPKLGPHEITAVLNELLKLGRVRKSAGRWSRAR